MESYKILVKNMKTSLGIIEGYYGRIYSEEERNSLISFIRNYNYSYYIYAPKNDSFLRRKWFDNISNDHIDFLKRLSEHCKNNSIQFGVGISPLGITKDLQKYLSVLLQKVDFFIKELNASVIAILFDDITLYTEDEGDHQKEIMNKISTFVKANFKDRNLRLIFCPTYYSFDPILDKCFGRRPEGYFHQITENLDKDVEIFWTGNKVLSKEITADDINSINTLLGRKVTIWDNYPVNDGKFICKHVYTREFKNRTSLDGVALSHAVNPMLEAELTKVAIATLPLCYKNESEEQKQTLRIKLLNSMFDNKSDSIIKLLDILNDEGIDAFSDEMKEELKENITTINTKAKHELIDFLSGVYKFDPACLTS